jgi:hypothetical protein
LQSQQGGDCITNTIKDRVAAPGRSVHQRCGLTPLIYSHVNPYGRFDLDLNNRIEIEKKAAA